MKLSYNLFRARFSLAIFYLYFFVFVISNSLLVENYAAALDEVMRLKPSASKGRYIKKAVLSSTMGPGIQVDSNRVKNLLVEDEA